jgi:hypothetical protein
MKAMKSTNGLIVAMLAIVLLAGAFWVLALGPKRSEATKLEGQVETLKSSLAQHRQEVAASLVARKQFRVNYQQLVVLGKAVPGDDDTASLLVQVNKIADHAKVKFRELELTASEAPAAAPVPATTATTTTEAPASPTEVAASLLPLGATIGAAGLGVMPYTLKFSGNFFHVADLMKGLDSMVKTENAQVAVNGRLVTINGFALEADPEEGFPKLQATFATTTYLTPPSQGVSAGATPLGPATEAAPASTVTGGAP